MIFREIYSVYFHTVAKILQAALSHPLSAEELQEMVEQNAFGESVLHLLPALKEEKWQVLKSDGTTPLSKAPYLPLTTVEKQWLKAIEQDPRLQLFGDISFDFPDVKPLFRPEDYLIFDRYQDGDPYEDAAYQAHFRLILDAIRNQYPLEVELKTRRGNQTKMVLLPKALEYSEKDDKFRLLGEGNRFGNTINLARIQQCRRYEKLWEAKKEEKEAPQRAYVVFTLMDRRKALERVMLHFAHFEKQAERLGESRYRVKVWYEVEDETELLIRLLSFGPLVQVKEPERMVSLLRQRLQQQRSCGL